MPPVALCRPLALLLLAATATRDVLAVWTTYSGGFRSTNPSAQPYVWGPASSGIKASESNFTLQVKGLKIVENPSSGYFPNYFHVEEWEHTNATNLPFNWVEFAVSTLGYQDLAFRFITYTAYTELSLTLQASAEQGFANPVVLGPAFTSPTYHGTPVYGGLTVDTTGTNLAAFAGKGRAAFRLVQNAMPSFNTQLGLKDITLTGTKIPNAAVSPPSQQVVKQGAGAALAASFTVSLDVPASLPVSVDYATVDGTAVAGADYTATSGTLTIAAGDTSGTVTVPVSDVASCVGGVVSFKLVLSQPVNAALSASSEAAVDIQKMPNVIMSVAPPAQPLAQGNGPQIASFKVDLCTPSANTVTVSYATADGSAAAPADYAAASGVLTFVPGEVSKTVDVAVADNWRGGCARPQKTFKLVLSVPVNALLAAGEVGATILLPPNKVIAMPPFIDEAVAVKTLAVVRPGATVSWSWCTTGDGGALVSTVPGAKVVSSFKSTLVNTPLKSLEKRKTSGLQLFPMGGGGVVGSCSAFPLDYPRAAVAPDLIVPVDTAPRGSASKLRWDAASLTTSVHRRTPRRRGCYTVRLVLGGKVVASTVLQAIDA